MGHTCIETKAPLRASGHRVTIPPTFGSLHSVMKVKYSSPNFLTSNNPAPVPMSSSRISSVREHIVPPHARAIRLLSDFRTRRIAVMFAFDKKYCAKSEQTY